MDQDAFAVIKDYLDQGKAFEVKFDGDQPVVDEAKGITKVSISKDELKGAKIRKGGKRKVPEAQKSIITSAAEAFLKNRVGFKVTFGPNESTIRFDLDHYIRLVHDKDDKSPDRCLVVGFKSMDEHPIALIKERLSIYPNVKLLSQTR
ncbi:MAG: hypothetical protein FJZ49_06495 [Candidatus Verstraetearchaeota archaeon]|nr:hypothetical protein [Candidatus Verstraetearchaeota archaeon]